MSLVSTYKRKQREWAVEAAAQRERQAAAEQSRRERAAEQQAAEQSELREKLSDGGNVVDVTRLLRVGLIYSYIEHQAAAALRCAAGAEDLALLLYWRTFAGVAENCNAERPRLKHAIKGKVVRGEYRPGMGDRLGCHESSARAWLADAERRGVMVGPDNSIHRGLTKMPKQGKKVVIRNPKSQLVPIEYNVTCNFYHLPRAGRARMLTKKEHEQVKHRNAVATLIFNLPFQRTGKRKRAEFGYRDRLLLMLALERPGQTRNELGAAAMMEWKNPETGERRASGECLRRIRHLLDRGLLAPAQVAGTDGEPVDGRGLEVGPALYDSELWRAKNHKRMDKGREPYSAYYPIDYQTGSRRFDDAFQQALERMREDSILRWNYQPVRREVDDKQAGLLVTQ